MKSFFSTGLISLAVTLGATVSFPTNSAKAADCGTYVTIQDASTGHFLVTSEARHKDIPQNERTRLESKLGDGFPVLLDSNGSGSPRSVFELCNFSAFTGGRPTDRRLKYNEPLFIRSIGSKILHVSNLKGEAFGSPRIITAWKTKLSLKAPDAYFVLRPEDTSTDNFFYGKLEMVRRGKPKVDPRQLGSIFNPAQWHTKSLGLFVPDCCYDEFTLKPTEGGADMVWLDPINNRQREKVFLFKEAPPQLIARATAHQPGRAFKPNMWQVYDTNYGDLSWGAGWYGNQNNSLTFSAPIWDEQRQNYYIEGLWGRRNDQNQRGGFRFDFAGSCNFSGHWWYEATPNEKTAWTGSCK